MKETEEIGSRAEWEEPAARQVRFAAGNITAEELKAHWANPCEPLFEHEIVKRTAEGKEVRTRVRVRAMTPEVAKALIENTASAWEPEDAEHLAATLEKFFEQRRHDHPDPLNVEYYAITDDQDRPFGMTGLYTNDIEGGAGFGTRDRLGPDHHLAAGLGWFVIDKAHQGTGAGGYLFDWTENLARARGAQHLFVETDDHANEAAAIQLYEKRGYVPGFSVPDYFGPGRNLETHAAVIPDDSSVEEFRPKEEITAVNREELLAAAAKIYSPERLAEFTACVDLLLARRPEEKSILTPATFVNRDARGRISSFGIMARPIYDNLMMCYWRGASLEAPDSQAELAASLKGLTAAAGREVLMCTGEGEDPAWEKLGFEKVGAQGVPGVFEKGDPTRFLLYTKRLR